MVTEEQLNNFVGTPVIDPKDIAISPSRMVASTLDAFDMRGGIWTQARIDAARTSLESIVGSESDLHRAIGFQDWWFNEGRYLPIHILDELGVRGEKTYREQEVEYHRQRAKHVKDALGIEDSIGDPLAVTKVSPEQTTEEKETEELDAILQGLSLDDLQYISDTITQRPLDFKPEIGIAVDKEIAIKERIPEILDVIKDKPLTILLGTGFFNSLAGRLPEFASRKGVHPIEILFGIESGETAKYMTAVSRIREMILAEDPRITTQMALGLGDTLADLIKFTLLPDVSKIKTFARLPSAVKAAIGVGSRAGMVELLKAPTEGEELTERAKEIGTATAIGAVTGATLSLLFSGAKAIFHQIKDIPVSQQATKILAQPGSDKLGMSHAELVRVLKHLKSTNPEQFARTIGYKAGAKPVVAREVRLLPTGFRPGMAEIEKAGEAGKEIVKGAAKAIRKGEQVVAAAAAKVAQVKPVVPKKVVSPEQAGPFGPGYEGKGEVPFRVISDAKVRASVQAGENAIAKLKTRLSQEQAKGKLTTVKATLKEIRKREAALETLKARHEVKLTRTVEEAYAKIEKIRTAKTFKEELRLDALSMIKAIPKDLRANYMNRAFKVKTVKGLVNLTLEIDTGIARFEKRQAVKNITSKVKKVEAGTRLGKVRFGKLPSPQREAIIEIVDSVDFKKLTAPKEASFESLEQHIQRTALRLAGELSAVDKASPDDPTGFVPNPVIAELGRLSKIPIADMETGDIRLLEIAFLDYVHQAKLKSSLLVKDGLRPLDGALKTIITTEIRPTGRAKRRAARKAAGEAIEVEKGKVQKIMEIPERINLADLHLDRQIESATGKDNATMVRLLDTELHRGQRIGSEKLIEWVDPTKKRFAELGFTSLNQIDAKVEITLAGTKLRLPLDYLIKLERHWRSPENMRAILKTRGWAIEGKQYHYPTTMTPFERIQELNKARAVVLANPMLKGLADWSEKLNPLQAQAINETHLRLKGYSIAYDPSYTSRPRALPKKIGGRTDIGIAPEQQSQYLPRTGGTAPIRLERWSKDFQRSVESDAFMHGMAIPLRNARVLVQTEAFQNAMKDAGRETELKNIILILSRTEGTPTSASMLEVYGRYLQRAVGITGLGYRVSSAGTAVMSYPAIGSEASTRSMMRSITYQTKAYLEKMWKDSSILDMRWRGRRINAEVGISASADSFSLLFFGKPSRVGDKSFAFIQRGDSHAIGNIHHTAVTELVTTPRNGNNVDPFEWEGKEIANLPEMKTEFDSDGYPTNTEVRYAAARRAEYLTRRSQPMYDSMDRSPLQGDPNVALTTFLPFRTALNAQLNVLYSTIHNFRISDKGKEAQANLIKGLGALGASALAVALWKKGFRWAKQAGIREIKEAFGIFDFDEKEELKTIEERATESLMDAAKNIGKLSTPGKVLVDMAEVMANVLKGDGYNWNREVLSNPALEIARDGIMDLIIGWPTVVKKTAHLQNMIVETADEPLTQRDKEFNERIRKEVVDAWKRAIASTISTGAKIGQIPVVAAYQEWIAPALRESRIKIIREVTFGDVENPREFATTVAKLYATRTDLRKKSQSHRLSRTQEDVLRILDNFVSIADKMAETISNMPDQNDRKDAFEIFTLRMDTMMEQLSRLLEEG